ncbi:MAG TPA: hypothetical protein PLA50_00875 [Bacteroidia bacterium]|nr:hypothetical protein [Bacteroidia bacterium]
MIGPADNDGAPSRSREDLQTEFLDHVAVLRDYWLSESGAPTAKQKVDGVIFSLLVLIDGYAEGGGWHLIPADGPEDVDLEDLAGDLHDRWSERERRKR